MTVPIPPNPAIVYVRYTQFDHDERVYFPRVESRMLSWCKSGKGEIRVNGKLFAVKADDYMFLPWAHSIEYHADPAEPFLVGGIHIVPDCAPDRPIDYHPVHSAEDPLANKPFRQNASMPAIEGIITGSFAWNAALGHLAEYAVQRLLYGEREDAVLRQLAHLLLLEMHRTVEAVGAYSLPLPGELRRLLRYVQDHLGRHIALHELADFSGLSRSTIGRLFKHHLRCTPGEWILQRRMQEAQRFLCTTRLPVGKVGRKVGIDDQFYFSKIFKKACGVSPLQYRQTRGIL